MNDSPLFSSHARDFSVRNSRFLCELSLAAYEETESKLAADLKNIDITDCRLVESRDTDTQALVASTRSAIIVAFRGTEPTKLKDLLTDVELTMVDGPLGTVHEGFFESLESIWFPLQRTIGKLHDGNRPIWFTGHSLGGALAQLSVARLMQMRRGVQGMYTYGSPRCGDKQFAREFQKRAGSVSFRLVNEADLIPDVTPTFLGFEHAGRHCQLDGQGRLLIDTPPKQSLLKLLSNTLEFFFDCEDDHSLAKGYLPKLAVLAPRESPPTIRLRPAA